MTMSVLDDATLENWFTYHQPDVEDVSKHAAIRVAALAFAKVIVEHTPACADQSAAIRHVRDAVFTANAAIACGGV
jgi:hypothetical protein